MITLIGATVDREFDLLAQETVPGTFEPYRLFSSDNEAVAEVDQNGRVTRISNGTARIWCRTVNVNRYFDAAVVRETGQTTISLDSYVAGSLARECSNAIDSRIAGQTPATAKPIFSTANHTTGNYVRNANCWAAEIDLTSVSPWNSNSGATFGLTAISPLHGLISRHVSWAFPIGTVVRFVTANGTVVTRTIVGKQELAGEGYAYDLVVVKFDSALPGTITIPAVLPSNVLDYLPSLSTTYTVPCLAINQENKALVTDLARLSDAFASCRTPLNATRLNFFEELVSGGSGRQGFLLISGQAVLVTPWTFGGAGRGPLVNALHSELNGAMTTLGGGHQLTVASLSGYTNFS